MDSGDQADEAWLLGIQGKLHQWSRKHPDERYGDLWNWVTDPRNLRCAWRRIARNKGSRTAGIDGITVAGIRARLWERRCSSNASGATCERAAISRARLAGS